MEKLFLFCVLLSVFLTSCDEGFEPKTDIQEKYVLYGVVVASDNKVTLQRSIGLKEVKVSRVFNIDSYDITKFSFDPVVNATVTASCDGQVVNCLSLKSRKDQDGYYIPAQNLGVSTRSLVSVKAAMPNGKTIYAQTYLLDWNYITKDYPFYNGFTSKINHFLWGNTFNLFWDLNKKTNLFFFSLSLHYSEMTDSGEVFRTKEIPFKYIKKNGNYDPVFPSYQFEKNISYDYAAIDSTIASIGAGKPDKSKIKLYWLDMKLLEFNTDLTHYYSSIHGFTDRFSIRLDEEVYSNVVNGIGVLGATMLTTDRLYFHPDYPGIFGYSVFIDW